MKTKLLILLAIPFVFYACKKDTYTTKPQISVKQINKKVLTTGDILLFQIAFTDKEGDIQDTLWVQKVSRVCPTTPGAQFLTRYRVPNFTPTKDLKGILEVGFAYNSSAGGYSSIAGCGTRNDTCYFKFWLKDKANNRSDTISTENIVLLR
ncbi:hypothetical protein [Sediminibacterium soli]|uniref:hypothetical protein n=1 Tax=Sediminibacterium soli TaxID=2698829 RepID=UPI00137A6003|nr:hypothetical protein [Sediminibacterium soli]NCI46090.1 hypothetical protein [Sediminibacterium soli]